MFKHLNYERSLLSLTASVLNHFGVKTKHSPLPEFDRLLEKNYKNVVIMLFDGLGVSAINEHLPADSFLRKHFLGHKK